MERPPGRPDTPHLRKYPLSGPFLTVNGALITRTGGTDRSGRMSADQQVVPKNRPSVEMLAGPAWALTQLPRTAATRTL
jgi:hypothetical protein